LLLLAAGAAALVGAWLVLRTIGPGFRVGRLLATTPRVSVEEAIRIASEGPPRYLRVDGRVDSDEDFEDAEHRPLVLRRTRIQARSGTRWSTVEDGRETVPFWVRDGLVQIGVDAGSLAEGLVVIPRHSDGVAADMPGRLPPDLSPGTPVRAVIEQVSSVEHAIVLGVPVIDGGSPRLTAGLGRPLVLTTLEPDEAMRILAAETPGRPRIAALMLAAGGILVTLAVAAWAIGFLVPAGVMAASPTPGAAGDPRSSGEGPGLVGEPLLALGIVIAIAIASIGLTMIYVRATGGPGHDRPPPRR
jgi:hypothetical protein